AGDPSAVNEATVFGETRTQVNEQPRPTRSGAQQPRGDRRAATANERARSEAQRRAANRARNNAPAAAVATTRAAPRLQLDPPEPQLSEEALAIERAIEVVAYAASAARQAASTASAAQSRISMLERTVGELRVQTQSQRDQLAQGGYDRRWLWLLGVAVLLSTAVALWLARRLADVQRDYEQRWLAVDASAAALPGAAPLSGRPTPLPLGPVERRQLGAVELPPAPPARPDGQPPAWPPAVAAQPWLDAKMQTTQPMLAPAPPRQFVRDAPTQRPEALPSGVQSTDADVASSPRDVTIEELLDLEQQAEFFVVLGQDDAAIDLLTEHLRNTGGGSPLPYLKLLEIYRRRGDRNDYERVRTRFNQRFNAVAPEWGHDLGAGKSLQDYAGILPRLQQVWARPLDAMAEMEALLFRKSRGDLFELPAYRELLFLYSLARDLLDRESADSGTVDLLLPLAKPDEGAGPFGPTAPAPYLTVDNHDSPEPRTAEERPTLPLDFDLTVEGQRQTSIFDPHDEQGRTVKPR
ncbi:MAG TPA: hypothetical protein VK570_12000, partial [Rubrivivax sp.]|nr:hypothetical protein [Rubrivivax sp.]